MPAARARPLHQRLITGLRYLLDNQNLSLNRLGAAGWLIGDELWLVVKTALDRLQAHLEQEGQTGVQFTFDGFMLDGGVPQLGGMNDGN